MNLGKRFELLCAADLQQYMTDNNIAGQIYAPIVDDSGIDLVVRMSHDKYKEIQIKVRADKNLFTIGEFDEGSNYWFVFYCKNAAGKYDRYILRSKEVKRALTGGNHLRITKDMVKYRERGFDCILK